MIPFFDPVYWALLGPAILLSLWASVRVKGTFARFSELTTRAGLSGAQVARKILAEEGIHDVRIERVPGHLSDHYDPREKVLRLSEPVHDSTSMAAVGVAAHEVGHAIQHAHGYVPLKLRSAWVPVASLGTGLSTVVIFAAFIMGGFATAQGSTVAWIGLGLFSTATIFTLITLPVEFDASRRALSSLAHGGYLTEPELEGARKVLSAAALTYVAAFVTALLTLLYWAMKLGLFGRREE